MESFLSLPRSAKSGLAVLLAVALLGWAVVAYSAKRQHEDVRSLESAIATLKSQEENATTALVERDSLQERLAAFETELASSREAVASSEQAKADAEARLAELEAEFESLSSSSEALAAGTGSAEQAGSAAEDGSDTDQTGALTLLETPDDDSEQAGGDDTTVSTDIDSVRARLTETMTSLSAKSATLQQRERELARVVERADAAEAEIESLTTELAEREAVRERLTTTMTRLSASDATLQQRDRELDKLKEEQEAAQQELETAKRAEEAAKETITDLEATIAERDQAELAERGEAREAWAAERSSLTAELDALEASLSEKQDGIAFAETELDQLEEEIGTAERRLEEVEAELQETLSTVAARDEELQSVEASLAAAKADQTEVEHQSLELTAAIDRQRTALEDLDTLKDELVATETALDSQTALLDQKRAEVADVEATLAIAKRDAGEETVATDSGQSAGDAVTDPGTDPGTGTDGGRSLPQIPIAALAESDFSVLPIDPMKKMLPVQTDNGIRLTLVHFDMGSAELTPGGFRRAKEAADWIKQQDVEKITLIGATDTIGTREDNYALAKRRAESLLEAFEAEGIDPARVELVSKGEAGGSEMIDDQTAEPLNRCVGVFIDREG